MDVINECIVMKLGLHFLVQPSAKSRYCIFISFRQNRDVEQKSLRPKSRRILIEIKKAARYLKTPREKKIRKNLNFLEQFLDVNFSFLKIYVMGTT